MTMGDRIAVMNTGQLQQLDTPQNLYDYPANRFVATFIGSPAMNVFPADVISDANGLRVSAADFQVSVPPERAERLRSLAGEQVLLGVRPEHIQVREYAEVVTEGNTIRMPVELVEPLGSETLLHLTGPDGMMIVARVDPRTTLRPGDVAELAVNTGHLHAFDPTTEEALTTPVAAAAA
jgi:multiple sugar transport system ATP-binding protein